jgi:menaquinone-specific isochorismate synthase
MSAAQKLETAFLRKGAGEYVIGHGPFESRSEPPESGVAFYRNDFWLSDPKPWKVPARVSRVARLQGFWKSEARLEVAWKGVSPGPFGAVYQEIERALKAGELMKSVPVVTERGRLIAGGLEGLGGALDRLPESLRAYGWLGGEEDFVGATPEVLVCGGEGGIRTMALAGTARSEDQVRFANDQKEIREHELVVRALEERLASVGAVVKGGRRLLDLGAMVHFETPMRVEIESACAVDELIKRLHPTPALGPLPRTEETLALLRSWRETLGCPAAFGAPFGVWDEGEFEILVAIRMLVCAQGQVLLPSGCGVIRESVLDKEWEELASKREAVKKVFGLAGEKARKAELPDDSKLNPQAA